MSENHTESIKEKSTGHHSQAINRIIESHGIRCELANDLRGEGKISKSHHS